MNYSKSTLKISWGCFIWNKFLKYIYIYTRTYIYINKKRIILPKFLVDQWWSMMYRDWNILHLLRRLFRPFSVMGFRFHVANLFGKTISELFEAIVYLICGPCSSDWLIISIFVFSKIFSWLLIGIIILTIIAFKFGYVIGQDVRKQHHWDYLMRLNKRLIK